MGEVGKLYIDGDGVTRGYYVYLHRESETRDVFYVGKGHGKRAWEVSRRTAIWKQKVATLSDAWSVEIAKSDLSEIEAFELEVELVDAFGGPASMGGRLANWIPGGETPAAVGIVIDLGPEFEKWRNAYRSARKFRDLPRVEQERVIRELHDRYQEILDDLESTYLETDGQKDAVLSNSIDDLDTTIRSQLSANRDFLRRRIRWRDFALHVEATVDCFDAEFLQGVHPEIKERATEAASMVKKLLEHIDTGNRAEALDVAMRETGESK